VSPYAHTLDAEHKLERGLCIGLLHKKALAKKEITAHHPVYIARHPSGDHERLWGGRSLICLT